MIRLRSRAELIQEHMKIQKDHERFWYYLPRILTIGFIVFLSIFALDVFVPHQTFFSYVIALTMHLFPQMLLIASLVVAWQRERVGALLFLLLGIVMTIWFETYQSLPNFLFVSFPIFLIAGLFLWHSYTVHTHIYEKNIV